jgi:hypothetical protein
MRTVGPMQVALLALVGLLVLGPRRLPGVAQSLGHGIGRGRGDGDRSSRGGPVQRTPAAARALAAGALRSAADRGRIDG